jgi:hypothetical protein
MLKLHDDIELTIGDKWEIIGLLLQEDGKPLPLTPDVQLGWTLLDPDGVEVPGLAIDATLDRLEPVTAGQVLIGVNDGLTRMLRPGRYTNAIRVWVEDAPSTLWRGMILAAADPFYYSGA